MITLQPIAAHNRAAAQALQLRPEQVGWIEPVSECLAEADRRACWRPVGIYDGPTLVGFAMYGFFWEYLPFGRVWLDRLLIDCRYQGRGYGKAAIAALLEQIQREYRRKKVYLSVYEDNQSAIRLYRQLGFRMNGQLDTKGEKIMVYRYPRQGAV